MSDVRIEGLFDISLSIPGPPVSQPGEPPKMQWLDSNDVLVAVRSLGLQQDADKGPVSTLVIDKIEALKEQQQSPACGRM